MNGDIKTIAVFLPFLGAALVGLNYTLNQKAFGSINLPTYLLVYCAFAVLAAILIHFLTPLKIDFSSLKQVDTRLIAISIPASVLAWVFTVIAIKNISADYTAIAEISYPLFTILFGYLLYERKIDWTTALGAVLIIAGSYVVVSHKLKAGG